MTVIVTDSGFAADDWRDGYVALADLAANDGGANLAVDGGMSAQSRW